jgi:hypothetical protein
MNLRVDLMQESEYRYQGPVSRKFAGAALGGFIGAVVLLWAAYAIEQELSLRKEIAQLSNDWNGIEARYKANKFKRLSYAACQSYQRELKPWADTRMDLADRLDELKQIVPPTIQLTRFFVQTEWEVIKLPPPPAPDANTIQGRAGGVDAEEDVRQLAIRLKSSRDYGTTFETIKLQRLLRDTQTGDQADHSFAIEGLSEPRKLE